MRLIICLDDKNGYSFANRRQSRDKIQLAKMLELAGDRPLHLNEYSAKLFESPPNNVRVSENFLKTAAEDDFCFVENLDISRHLSAVKQLIVYRWNRAYPSDKKLPDELFAGKKLISTVDFAGNSHERITEEVYE